MPNSPMVSNRVSPLQIIYTLHQGEVTVLVKLLVNQVHATLSWLFSLAKKMLPDSVKRLLPLLRSVTTSKDRLVLNSTSG